MPDAPPQLVAAQRRMLERIEAATQVAMVAAYEQGDLATMVALILAAQRSVVAATDAGFSLMAGVATSSTTQPMGIDPSPLIGANARNGTSLEEVYSRPGSLARQTSFDRGLSLLRSTIATDLQLAHRQGAHAHVMADRRVSHWRRVLGSRTPCGLCVVASTREYYKADLLGIHRSCHCKVVEVYSDQVGSGPFTDQSVLADVYAKAGGTSAKQLGSTPIDLNDLNLSPEVMEQIKVLSPSIRFDNELGPVLEGTRHDSQILV